MRIALMLTIAAALLMSCGRGGPKPQVVEPTPGVDRTAPSVIYPDFGDADPHDWEGRHPGLYPIHGLDVSRWQGPIDWRTAKASGVSFAFLKATEGGDVADPLFDDHRRGAQAAGVPWGLIITIISADRPGNRRVGSFRTSRKGQICRMFLTWSGRRIPRPARCGPMAEPSAPKRSAFWTFSNGIMAGVPSSIRQWISLRIRISGVCPKPSSGCDPSQAIRVRSIPARSGGFGNTPAPGWCRGFRAGWTSTRSTAPQKLGPAGKRAASFVTFRRFR